MIIFAKLHEIWNFNPGGGFSKNMREKKCENIYYKTKCLVKWNKKSKSGDMSAIDLASLRKVRVKTKLSWSMRSSHWEIGKDL